MSAVANLVRRVPIGIGLGAGMGIGMAAGVARETYAARHPHGRHNTAALLVQGLGGTVLMGVGLVGAMTLEHMRGPFVDRFQVNGVEQIAHRRLNLDWSTLSGRAGAMSCGLGIGLLQEAVLVGGPYNASHKGHS